MPKPSGAKTRGTRIACRACFQSRVVAHNGIVFCPHRNVLQAWIGNDRVVITNAENREDALLMLRAVRKRMRAARMAGAPQRLG